MHLNKTPNRMNCYNEISMALNLLPFLLLYLRIQLDASLMLTNFVTFPTIKLIFVSKNLPLGSPCHAFEPIGTPYFKDSSINIKLDLITRRLSLMLNCHPKPQME